MTKRELYDKAISIIGTRRQRALLEAKLNQDSVIQLAPELLELDYRLSQTAIRLSKLILAKKADSAEVIPQIMQENLTIQRRKASLLQQLGYPADFLDTKFTCPKCSDTGYVSGDRCDCLKSMVKQLAIEQFNQSTTMSLSTFEDFQLGYYNDQNLNPNNLSDQQIMSQIYQFCMAYAKGFSLRSPSILMTGNTGLGKTHLSLSIANHVIAQGHLVLYGTAQEFFQKIQNEFFGKGQPGVDTNATILGADLFILDDLGAEYESNFNTSTFYNIINTRLNANKPTIINTNLTLKQIETRYTNRVASRLATLYKCLKFVGTDIRQIKLNR